ncbi:hypothetical protein BAUCODRAFT_406566 [Baudoinia panamericana UAMH 10762]|uniref:Uncharacterized protein n=1 Tax=Baudoinia panamericana (strain UAMH 10762) TaxID=717646 RepID=M2NF49_BAUPA|nr:uncharacterized protein BAUCODRAFT_406566 [Baudoinia panamericana UAMH 10762]EMC97879.1 hypothetical protein BAUCODRAFT_406566 [Baudoinia panamericana UAMH 10762]
MPTVFGAGHDNFDKTLYDTVVDDSRGYVSGGAYIGRAMPAAADQLHEIELKDPQTYYAKGLKRRFLEQRRQMHLAPGLAALEELNDKHPISLPSGSNKAYAEWGRLLKTTAPLAVQVRSMEQATVRRLLELTDRLYLLRGKDIDTVTSTWIWSLLARLDDVGTMDNDEVCAIRDLGKKAVLVQLSFRDSAAAKQLDDLGARSSPEAFNPAEVSLEDEEDDATNGTPTTPSNTAIGIPAKRQNTLATLDMIITVVGDVFGQRDLLEFRQKWEATVGASKSTLS